MIAPVNLPRLASNFPIVEEGRAATLSFARDWNTAMQSIETTLNAILVLPVIQQALADLDAATAAAQAAADAASMAAASANTAAGNAQTSADTVTASSALASSYVNGLTISAADAGTDAAITISAHTRVYATNPLTMVSVSGGMLTGQPYDTDIYVYYDQPSRAGGAVSYMATTDPTAVAQVNDRHSVAKVHTPLAAAPANNGRPVAPPGGRYIDEP